jgi:hypothetical protein
VVSGSAEDREHALEPTSAGVTGLSDEAVAELEGVATEVGAGTQKNVTDNAGVEKQAIAMRRASGTGAATALILREMKGKMGEGSSHASRQKKKRMSVAMEQKQALQESTTGAAVMAKVDSFRQQAAASKYVQQRIAMEFDMLLQRFDDVESLTDGSDFAAHEEQHKSAAPPPDPVTRAEILERLVSYVSNNSKRWDESAAGGGTEGSTSVVVLRMLQRFVTRYWDDDWEQAPPVVSDSVLEQFQEMQRELVSYGVVQLVVELISHGNDPMLVEEAIVLGIVILYHNRDTQHAFYECLFQERSDAFFSCFASALDAATNQVHDIMSEAEGNFTYDAGDDEQDPQDEHARITRKLRAATHRRSIRVLRFSQLLCEHQYEPMQSAMTDQSESLKNSITSDLLGSAIGLINALMEQVESKKAATSTGSGAPAASMLAVAFRHEWGTGEQMTVDEGENEQIGGALELLVECMQGPHLGNQAYICNSEIIPTIKTLLSANEQHENPETERLGMLATAAALKRKLAVKRGDGGIKGENEDGRHSAVPHNLDRVHDDDEKERGLWRQSELQTKAIKVLVCIVEGREDPKLLQLLEQKLDFSVLRTMLSTTWAKSVQLDRLSVHVSIHDIEQSRQLDEHKAMLMRRAEDYCYLKQQLAEISPKIKAEEEELSSKKSDRKSNKRAGKPKPKKNRQKDDEYSAALRYFEQELHSVEIVWNGRMVAVTYMRPKICDNFTSRMQQEWTNSIDQTAESKVPLFIQQSITNFYKIQQVDQLMKNYLYQQICNYEMYMRSLNFMLALLMNFIMLISLSLPCVDSECTHLDTSNYRFASYVDPEKPISSHTLKQAFEYDAERGASSPIGSSGWDTSWNEFEVILFALGFLNLLLSACTLLFRLYNQYLAVYGTLTQEFKFPDRQGTLFLRKFGRFGGHGAKDAFGAATGMFRCFGGMFSDTLRILWQMWTSGVLSDSFSSFFGSLVGIAVVLSVIYIRFGYVPISLQVVVFFVYVYSLVTAVRNFFRNLIHSNIVCPPGPFMLVKWGAFCFCCVYDTVAEYTTIFFIGHFVLCFCGMLISPFFYCFLLLEVVNTSPTLNNVVRSITESSNQLMMTTLLGLIAIYIFAAYGFFFLQADKALITIYGRDECDTLFECLLFALQHGLVIGETVSDEAVGAFAEDGGLANFTRRMLKDKSSDDDAGPEGMTADSAFAQRYIYDIFFFIIVLVLLLNMIFGIIIDKFGELRDQQNENIKAMTEYCFICGMEGTEIDTEGQKRGMQNAFKHHVEEEHHM